MKLKRFLSKSRIIDIKSTDFKGAVAELIDTLSPALLEGVDKKKVLADVMERETAISTYLGNGICMPHTRVDGLKQKYVFSVGRCPNGLIFDGADEYKQTRMLFLLLSDEDVNTYLTVLSTLAKTFSAEPAINSIKEASDISKFRAAVLSAFDSGVAVLPGKIKNASGVPAISKPKLFENKLNDSIAKSALKVAKVANCSSIILQGDAFANIPDLSSYLGDMNVVVVSERSIQNIPDKWSVINVRSFSNGRFAQLRSAVMIGLTRGIFKAKDKICCIGGVGGSNQIDSIVILDIEKEFSDIFVSQKILPECVKPEVIERILDIATELSVEGREGKPVGCIFVIGDVEELKPHLKQLILNPFYGYKPEDRNVLNPFMDETVKEYSLIDGAFIIDGKGILESAGSLIHTPDFKLQLPGGLGARHAAAYAISLMADCISLVVSSSTGQITLFRKGQMMPISEKRKN